MTSGERSERTGRRRLVIRWHHALPAVALVLAVVGAIVSLARRPAKPAAPGGAATAAGDAAPVPLPATPPAIVIPRRTVTLYWPMDDPETAALGLAAREAEIFATVSALDQAKQVVGLLLQGPEPPPTADAGPAPGASDEAALAGGESAAAAPGDESPAGPRLVAPFPRGTSLRHLFLDPWGTAHVDLSEEAVEGAPGGSRWELMATRALANSLIRSVPEIRRVRLLIGGREVETLAGHLDVTRGLEFDESLVLPEES